MRVEQCHRRPAASRRRRPAARSLATVAILVGTTVPALPATPAIALPVPPVPAGLSRAIEPFPALEPQSGCDPTPKPGVLAFRDLVLATYPGTGSAGTLRACDVGGRSEHKVGRAWDWALSATDAADRVRADALLGWLLGTDARGHRAAMARRLGVMYVIWRGQIWSAARASEGWRPYTGPDAHTGHVHFSFTSAGAMRRTSYWSAPSPLLVAPHAATVLRVGSSGPAVVALEQALRLPADGRYDAGLRAAVVRWQRRHGLSADGVVGANSWRALRRSLTGPEPRPALPTPALPTGALPTGASGGNPLLATGPLTRAVMLRHADATLEAGDRGPAVTVLQQALPGLPRTGWFGPRTHGAVVRFQQAQQLPVDGVVGPATWARLATTIPADPGPTRGQGARLQAGDTGPAVRALQRALRVRPVSGFFGERTWGAVVAFQQRRGLPADGVVGPATRRALAESG